MKDEIAVALVRSLLGRMTRVGDGFQLPNATLSMDEIEALSHLAKAAAPPRLNDAAELHELVLREENERGPDESDRRLCIDFGTAMSKAWATGATSADQLPLVLGIQAGIGEELPLPSSVYISSEGKLFFGAAADIQHRQDTDPGRARFDNLKRMLSDAEIGQDLYSVALGPGIDPTNSGLTKGDLLVLYLGWLTDMALMAEAEARGQPVDDISSPSRLVRRRFAIPCFEDVSSDTFGRERAEWARKELGLAMVRAQIVADTLHGRWADLDTSTAKSVVRRVRALPTSRLPSVLTEITSIREPIAAGGSLFDEDLEQLTSGNFLRQYCLVIDAGAGTTDFALFLAHRKKDDDPLAYSLIASSVRMSRIAGNEIDDILRPIILRACGINPETGSPRGEEEFGYIKQQLSSRIRELKQQLFGAVDGTLKVDLPSNASGSVTIQDLLDDPRYQSDGVKLDAIVQEILETVFTPESVEEQAKRRDPQIIHVLLTGGSSHLGIIKSIANKKYFVHEAEFRLRQVQNTPSWIGRLDPRLSDLIARMYPQAAVAIGGSLADVPEEVADVNAAVVIAPKGRRILERMQVTGVG